MGGLGLSPAFPVGASLRAMKAHEPILVDFGTCYHGYQADETRMFSIGKMKQKFIDAYNACREIYDAVLDESGAGRTVRPFSLRPFDWQRDWLQGQLPGTGTQTRLSAMASVWN
jgi:hypothetical protein